MHRFVGVLGRPCLDGTVDREPSGPAGSIRWERPRRRVLRLNGATFDASGALTNEAGLIALWSGQIRAFVCNYLASRVRDSATTGITRAQAIAAADRHAVTVSWEVATAFM